MHKFHCIAVSVFIGISALVIGYFFKSKIVFYLETEKCPYCYGESLCEAFRNNEITTSITSFIFTEKNVFYGDFNKVNVVIKKLGSASELVKFDKHVCNENYLEDNCDFDYVNDQQNYTEKIVTYMDDHSNLMFKSFKVCSKDAANLLFDYFLNMKSPDIDEVNYLKNIWTILKINIEPLICQLLKSEKGWPLPVYYGSCGRLAVMEYCGSPLLDNVYLPWMDRAHLALQLLYGAKNFTFDHPYLRFYLTDVSPDNIAVDDTLKVTFIDLENLVVLHSRSSPSTFHKSEVIYDLDGFAYVEEELCSHSISDHNYYAVCKLLLSTSAPYPMVKNGLLHTPPVNIKHRYPRLFDFIEECSDAKNLSNRFDTGEAIINILNEILSSEKQQIHN